MHAHTCISQVLSKSVTDVLSLAGDSPLCETECFVRNFDKVFDCMNVHSLNEAQYKRKLDHTTVKVTPV